MCSKPIDEYDTFRFGIVNVGQGLSQIGIVQNCAIVWDIGPQEGFQEWSNVYLMAGKPFINAIVLSHSDRDHSGALTMLNENINWSGVLVVNTYEDTSFIKNLFLQWKKPIMIRIIGQNDTLMLGNDVSIDCLWPPGNLSYEKPLSNPNLYNLAFRVQHKFCSILISSDLDSASLEILSQTYGSNIRSDIFIIPHHGSKNSYSYSFFTLTDPVSAVVSYGKNTFGHPSKEVISLLLSMNCEIMFTATNGTCYFSSNAFYWTQCW